MMLDEEFRAHLDGLKRRAGNDDPKRAAGVSKVPLSMISPAALEAEARVMALGAAKYGAYNFTDNRMKASTYADAMLRHILQWWAGEDCDQESGQPHLAHLRACAAILIEQAASGMLIDDRPKWANLSDLKLEDPKDGSK